MRTRKQLPTGALEWAANDPVRRKVKWDNWEPGHVTCEWRYGKLHRKRLVATRCWPIDRVPATPGELYLSMRARAIDDLDGAVAAAEARVRVARLEERDAKSWRTKALAKLEEAP